MMYAPLVRILLRYGVGALAGWTIGDTLASDPDVVDLVVAAAAAVVAVVTEWWYQKAKRDGGAT